jgi:hypothetical protein
MEKLGFGLSKKKGLEMIRRYVNENNITTPLKGGARGYYFLIRIKNALVKSEKDIKC